MSDDPDKKGKAKGLSARDATLWRQFTRDIDPLPGHELDADFPPDPPPENAAPRASVPPVLPDRSLVRHASGEDASQIDRRTEEKLRRGKMDIDARLDLHGMTREKAHDALRRFIENSYARHLRCVLVITGKGKSSSRNDEWIFNDGVLRQVVPEWLTFPPLGDVVLRVMTAQPKDGGEGAYYVYLRRRR